MRTRQHRKGRWHVDCHLEHVAGLVARRRHYTDGDGSPLSTKTEAEAHALVLATRLGKASGDRKRTFADAVVAWQAEQSARVASGAIAAATAADDDGRVRRHICAWHLGGVPIGSVRLAAITPLVLRNALLRGDAQLLNAGLSQPSKLKLLQRLKSIFAAAVVEGWIASNPAASLTLPGSKDDPLSRALDPGLYSVLADQLPAIFAELETIAPWAVLTLKTIRRTGMRIGELRALSLQQVEATGLRIDRAVKSGGGVGKTKNGVKRFVPLPLEAVSELRQHAVACGLRGDAPLFSVGEAQLRHVFYQAQLAVSGRALTRCGNSNTTARAYSLDGVRHSGIASVFGAARLPRFGVHALRHLFASQLFHAGRPLAKVAARLGDSERTTQRYYVHWLDDSADDAADLSALEKAGAFQHPPSPAAVSMNALTKTAATCGTIALPAPRNVPTLLGTP